MLEEAETRKVSLWSLVLDTAQGRRKPESKVSAQAQKGIEQFVHIILTSRQKLVPGDGDVCNLLDLISHLLQKISFEAYLRQTHKENWEDRWANVEELVAQATQMATAIANGEEITDDALPVVDGIEQREDSAADILSKFLANVTLSSAADQEGSELNQVTISTIHAAKGLEWPVVFLPALYDGSIPHSRAEDHDEERRLLYVGMTRAQGLLYLSCPLRQTGQEHTTLSKFVSGRKLQKLFSTRGPDLAFNRNTIPELARILRRPCPQPADLAATHALLDCLEDERYPATREEIDNDSSKWGASYDNKFVCTGPSSDNMPPPFKRRKIETTANSFADEKISISMHQTSGFSTATTTMQRIQAGFTSARDLGDIQAMQQEAAQIHTLANAPRTQSKGSQASRPAATAMPDELKPKSTRTHPAKPRATGQNSITSFFQRTASSASQGQGKAFDGGMPRTLSRWQSEPSAPTPLLDISNVQHAAPSPLPSSPHLRVAAPVEPCAHKLHARPMPSKPRRTAYSDEDEAAASTRYILRSSSPVIPDAEVGVACEPSDDACGAGDGEGGPMAPSREARPAVTLHTTSMARLQDAGAPRKTLGTRRSMQGWSVKRHGMPKPRLS